MCYYLIIGKGDRMIHARIDNFLQERNENVKNFSKKNGD